MAGVIVTDSDTSMTSASTLKTMLMRLPKSLPKATVCPPTMSRKKPSPFAQHSPSSPAFSSVRM